ncbi:fungal specific transcription factor [Hirsutella rhossiliensis]|uniref:Fungal specific transcription factor n=1 Tax=Hirsutella rhossiliensis TaxID=111463 RepID=A0A9P8N6I2_9HYPO|nr:Fungal specific transcription factor [Hirsutella rhossiliensis]KAH0966689.1 Fungal specific transcription factor [Hirsutella rhossiliensis]
MSGAVSGGYMPVYADDGELPDPEVRTFITNFYRISDRPDANELWISYFAKDAHVTMGTEKGRGEQEIRELRSRMWTTVRERRHTVAKVFPGRFRDDECECEVMLFGEVKLTTKEGNEAVVPWAAHGGLRREGAGWKFARYRVWLQK